MLRSYKPPTHAKETNMELKDVKLEQIHSAYRGSANKCHCGCSGKYYYAKAHQEAAGKSRGYDVDDDEVNDATLERIFKKVQKHADAATSFEGGWNVTLGHRDYTIYIGD